MSESEPLLVDAKTLAAAFGVSDRRVRQFAEQGVIPRAERGKYPLVESVQGWMQWFRAQVAAKPESISRNPDRAEIWKARAERERLETDELFGLVYRRDEADAAMDSAMGIVSRHLRGLGSRICGDLAGLSEPAAICEHVDRETHAILEAASRELLRVAESPRGKRAHSRATTTTNGRRVGGREARAPAGIG